MPSTRRWYRLSLTAQIMIGLVVGVLIGWLRPEWGNKVYFLRDIFLNLIRSIIGPLVFSTLVVGIAGGGDLRLRMNWFTNLDRKVELVTSWASRLAAPRTSL